jgi:hypothetical protein
MILLYGCFVKGLLQAGEFQVKRLFSALGIRCLALGWFALAGHGKSLVWGGAALHFQLQLQAESPKPRA